MTDPIFSVKNAITLATPVPIPNLVMYAIQPISLELPIPLVLTANVLTAITRVDMFNSASHVLINAKHATIRYLA